MKGENKMNINELSNQIDDEVTLEAVKMTTWEASDEATQDAMLKVITESDNGEMVKCDSMTCETIITESGSYYEETLKSFMVDESIIDDEDDYDVDSLNNNPSSTADANSIPIVFDDMSEEKLSYEGEEGDEVSPKAMQKAKVCIIKLYS